MSWLPGHAGARSKASSKQGTIRTDNPELLKLLQEVSPDNQDNKRPSPSKLIADTETNTHVLDLAKKNSDTEDSKNFKNLLNNQKREITKPEHLKENIFICDSGDDKENSSYRGGKENYNLTDNNNDINETDIVNISDSSNSETIGIVNEDSTECFDSSCKEYPLEKLRISAETRSTTSLARRKHLIVEDPSLLSDFSESDCETVGSVSSELATLKTPSRSSLNADFEDSSLPSSPVHPLPSQSDKNKINSGSESDRDRISDTSLSGRDSVTSEGNRRRAGATPFYSSQRHHSTTPSVDIEKEEQDNSDCSNTSEVITPVASPAQTLLNVDSPNQEPQGNITHRSTHSTTALQEKSLGSENKFRTDELVQSKQESVTSKSTAFVSSSSTREPKTQVRSSLYQSGLHPAYSKLSPQISPRSSQSEVINSKLQELTKDTSNYLQDTLTPRVNIPYLSQRLKSRRDTGKRSTSVSVVKDSLDSEILDIEKDSLDLTQTDKKDNSSNYNQEKVSEQSNQASVSSLKDSLIERSTQSKLGDNTVKRNKENKVVAISSERTPIPIVDLQKKFALPDKGQQKQTINHELHNAPSANTQEQELFAPMSNSQEVELEEFEHKEFVLRTKPTKQAVVRNYPAEGSSKHLHHASGSVQSSNRTTPSVKKVYIESPVFTKEEEGVYRFVTSRLEDSKDKVMETYRELDMAVLDNQEKYAARFAGQKRVRYMNVDERYEDTDDQGLSAEGSDQFLLANAHAQNSGQLRQAAQRGPNGQFGEAYADKENQMGRYETDPRNRSYQQGYGHHPASLQHQSQAGILGQGKLGHNSSVPQNQMFNNHQDFPVNSNQLQGLTNNLQMGYNQGLGQETQPNARQGLLHQQGQITQYGFTANQQGLNSQGFREDRFQQPQILQGPPTNNISQQPSQQDQQHGNNPEQPQDKNPPPVRGLSLPTGPTYDPKDEEDLKREKSYQQGLRLRIEDRNRRTHQTTIPELPVNANHFQHQFDPLDYVQDSLDDEFSDEMAQSFSGGFVNDSLNMYTLQQQQQQHHHQQQQYHRQPVNPFRNPPPPLPQNFANSVSNNNFPENRSSRLDNVNFDSEDYTDHVDIRQQRVNPQIRPRFYNPQFDHQQGILNNGEYFDEDPNSGRIVANTAYDVYQRYEDRDEDDVEQPMEAVQPKPPKYDYVINNKENLGKQAPKSYIRIHETTKEEKERLQEVFIQPKRKPKGVNATKQSQGQGFESAEVINCQPENDEYLTAAEQVWAQRSSTLSKKVDGGGNRGRRRGPGSLQKFNSDSSLSQTSIPHRRQSFQTNPQLQQQQQQHLQQQQQHLQHHQQQQLHRTQQQKPPDTRAFLTEMPTPLSGASMHSQPVQGHNPMPQHQSELLVQPITQHLLTQDGQRISVDVNLKLISPPSFGEAPLPYQYQQQLQQHPPQQHPPPQHPPPQYPPPQHPHPQFYGGHARQYPAAVTSYDDSGGQRTRNGMPALEYPLQEFYDSDSNDYRHGSPRERYSADEALRLLSDSRTDLNPYGKIPPIGRAQAGDHPSSAPAPDQAGSYMDVYMKQKVKDADRPWYKVYGLKDYRRMQKEVRLGTLGPDLDSDAVKERREKMTRQQDYAKTVMQKNRSELSHRKPPAFPRPKEENDILRRRKLAIEYAKSVPKPTVKVQPNEFNNYELASEKSPIAKHHGRDNVADGHNQTSPRQPPKKGREMDILDLEKLRQRYEEDKMNEAIIRRNTHSLNKESYY